MSSRWLGTVSIVAAALLAGSSSVSWAQLYGVEDNHITNERLRAEINAHLDCLTRYAKELDDHVSEASAIGEIIERSCPAKLPGVGEGDQGLSPLMQERMHRISVTTATNVVLKMRASQAAALQEK